MAVVHWITLQSVYPVGIVTGGAWRRFVNYVFAVLRKTLIVQDASPAMTFIAERVV
jgi:type III secretory pathway component EscR